MLQHYYLLDTQVLQVVIRAVVVLTFHTYTLKIYQHENLSVIPNARLYEVDIFLYGVLKPLLKKIDRYTALISKTW